MIIPAVVGDLLDDIMSDLMGGIIGVYTDTLGPIFWVFGALILLLPLQNRIGIMPIIIICGMIWGTLIYVLPATGLNVIYAIMYLAGASALVILFFSRRRQYG